MEKGNKNLQMEIYIKGNIKMESLMEKGNILGIKEASILVLLFKG